MTQQISVVKLWSDSLQRCWLSPASHLIDTNHSWSEINNVDATLCYIKSDGNDLPVSCYLVLIADCNELLSKEGTHC